MLCPPVSLVKAHLMRNIEVDTANSVCCSLLVPPGLSCVIGVVAAAVLELQLGARFLYSECRVLSQCAAQSHRNIQQHRRSPCFQ